MSVQQCLSRLVVVAIALVTGACATNIAPPMERGVYVAHGFCFEQPNCVRTHWRATGSVPVHTQVDPRSPVIATIAPGEWVTALDAQFRFLPRGDNYVIWRRGEYLFTNWGASDANAPITWGPHPRDQRGAIAGWWFLVQLENGKIGWTEGGPFACIDAYSQDEGCRD